MVTTLLSNSSFSTKSLIEVLQVIRNGTTAKQNNDHKGYPVTRIETISSGQINDGKVGFAELDRLSTEKYRLEVGDILFSHINSKEHIGKTAIYEGIPNPLIHGMNLLLLRPNKDIIIPQYLHYYLKSNAVRSLWRTRARQAVNQASLNQNSISELKVPVPDIPTQKKIVAVLEEADRLKKQRKETNQLANKLLQATFMRMFGDPATNPKKWKLERLVDLSTRITKGESPKWQHFKYVDDGPLFVRSENVRWGYLDLASETRIPFEFHSKLKRSKLQENDVLINLVGASIGRSAIFPKGLGEANINQAVAVITPNSRLNSIYLVNLLISPYIQSIIQRGKVDVARANISLGDLRSLTLPVPPIELQNKFSSIINNLMELQNQQQQSTIQISNLFDSLISKAFKGELVS